jgi:hypothetical protein
MFNFKPEFVGEDIVLADVYATWWGDESDYESGQDDGTTASGINTKDHTQLRGCSLPVVKYSNNKLFKPTCNSPIAFKHRIPWGTLVEIQWGIKKLTVPLIDNGPAESTGNTVDLTTACFKFFGIPLQIGRIQVTATIIGGAKYRDQDTT